jgi:hypothetical protein
MFVARRNYILAQRTVCIPALPRDSQLDHAISCPQSLSRLRCSATPPSSMCKKDMVMQGLCPRIECKKSVNHSVGRDPFRENGVRWEASRPFCAMCNRSSKVWLVSSTRDVVARTPRSFLRTLMDHVAVFSNVIFFKKKNSWQV